MNTFSVILAAAGDSTRLKEKIRKPFVKINSLEILSYSLIAFSNFLPIKEIIVVGKKEDECKILNLARSCKTEKKIKFSIGKITRQDSIFAGAVFTDKNSTHLIIHDAARPLISKKVIEKSIKFSEKHEALSVGTPLNDTIKKIDDQGYAKLTIDRKKIFKIQTPQVFKKKLYFKAYKFALKQNKNFTDDCQLIENIGKKVFIFEGDRKNIKITQKEDLKIAEAFLKIK